MSRDKLISNVTSEEIFKKWTEPGSLIAYAGIDPTASGIHMGHLLWIHLAIDLLKNGHKFIILIGGFTGQIGDPTDKNAARTKIASNIVNENCSGILNDIKLILKPYDVTYVNNTDWLGKMTIGEYINHYGYGISVNRKLKMETFMKRIRDQNNLTVTEFFYPDLQMIDFCYLNEKFGCNLQLGGHDQYGNIAFGTHYTEHFRKTKVYGVVTHLLTESNGRKLGKSTGAKLLRDFRKTHHFCMNISDEMANQICEFFDIKIEENPQNTKKSLIKYIFSLFDRENYEKKYNEVEEYMKRLFYSDVSQALPEDFVNLQSKNVLDLITELNFVENNFEGELKLKEKAVKINGKFLTENQLITAGKYKISMGKKSHAFVNII